MKIDGLNGNLFAPYQIDGVKWMIGMEKQETGPKGGLTKGINKWLRQKQFQWNDKKTGRFLSYEAMSFIISRSIYNKGLKANLFFTKPFEAGLKRLPDDMLEAFSLDIENAIILGTKK